MTGDLTEKGRPNHGDKDDDDDDHDDDNDSDPMDGDEGGGGDDDADNDGDGDGYPMDVDGDDGDALTTMDDNGLSAKAIAQLWFNQVRVQSSSTEHLEVLVQGQAWLQQLSTRRLTKALVDSSGVWPENQPLSSPYSKHHILWSLSIYPIRSIYNQLTLGIPISKLENSWKYFGYSMPFCLTAPSPWGVDVRQDRQDVQHH